jgi:hypothetical protein
VKWDVKIDRLIRIGVNEWAFMRALGEQFNERIEGYIENHMPLNYPLKLLLSSGEKVKSRRSKSWPLRTTILGI